MAKGRLYFGCGSIDRRHILRLRNILRLGRYASVFLELTVIGGPQQFHLVSGLLRQKTIGDPHTDTGRLIRTPLNFEHLLPVLPVDECGQVDSHEARQARPIVGDDGDLHGGLSQPTCTLSSAYFWVSSSKASIVSKLSFSSNLAMHEVSGRLLAVRTSPSAELLWLCTVVPADGNPAWELDVDADFVDHRLETVLESAGATLRT